VKRCDPCRSGANSALAVGRAVRCTFRPVPTIALNGEPHEIPAGTTVAGLVASLGLNPQQIAVERNREIVPRSAYPSTPLAEGDTLEVVTFVGGG
jgi:sulfur carrier protein